METTRHVVAGSCAIHVAGKLRKVGWCWVGWLRWVGDSFCVLFFVLVGAGGPHCQLRGRRTGNVPTTNCRFENFRAHFVEHQTKRGNGRAYEKCRSVRDAHPLLFCRLNTVPFVTCITFEYSYEHSFFLIIPLNNH